MWNSNQIPTLTDKKEPRYLCEWTICCTGSRNWPLSPVFPAVQGVKVRSLTLPYVQPSSILFIPHSSWMFSASLSRMFSRCGGRTICIWRKGTGTWEWAKKWKLKKSCVHFLLTVRLLGSWGFSQVSHYFCFVTTAVLHLISGPLQHCTRDPTKLMFHTKEIYIFNHTINIAISVLWKLVRLMPLWHYNRGVSVLTESACGDLPSCCKSSLKLRWWRPHLAGVHGSGDEGGLREELGGSQQVADPLVVPLVLLDRLHAHLLLGQQRLVARRVTGRRQEFEITMTTTQQETHPDMRAFCQKIITMQVILCFELFVHQLLQYKYKTLNIIYQTDWLKSAIIILLKQNFSPDSTFFEFYALQN